MRIYNGTFAFTDLSYVSQGSLTDPNSETILRINFNATSPTVVIAWGGHIASELDWGAGNSASALDGAPYHTRIVQLDNDQIGNQDRSLQAGAVLTCNISGPTPVCAGTTNTYTASTNQSNASISWSFASNNTGATFVGSTNGALVQVNAGAAGGGYVLRAQITKSANSVTCEKAVTVDPQATVSAGADQTVCAGSPVTLNGTVGGGASSGTWSGGTGTFNPNANTLNAQYTPSATEIATGSVTLTLATNDPAGPCPAASDQMSIFISPAATVNAGADQTVCSNNPSVTLNGSVGGAATTGTWSGGTGTFDPNANTLNAQYTPSAAEIATGSVTLTLTTNDPAGPCQAVSDQMNITINPAATGNAGANQTVCASSPTVTLAGSVGGGASSGTWSGGTGIFNPNANTLNAAYTPSPAEILAGTVTLTLTTNDPAGPCEAVSDQMIITINPPATANAGLDQTVCASSPIVTLAGSVGGVSGGTWSGGTGTFNPNANTLNAAYTPSPAEILAGTVTLTLTTNDPAGPCEAVSDQMIITINPPATANAGLDQTVCASSPIVTLAGSVGGVSGGTWSGGTGTFNPNANTLNAAYTPSPAEILAGTVTLTLTTNDPAGPCEAVSDQMIITINPPATANAGLDQTVCASSPIVTLAGSVGGVSGGTWSGGTGTFNPNANTLNAAYTPSPAEILAGTVTLTLTTNDPAGPCEAVSDQMIITINPPATANAGLDQTVCASSPIVTLAGSVGGVSGGTWSGGTGTFNPNANTLNAAYTPSPAEILAGTVTLTLTTNDPAGPCEAVSDQMIITINPPATANAGLDQTVCASSPIVTLAGSVGGVSGGTWSGGTGTFNPNANTLNAAYTPSPAEILAGTVTLTLTTNDPAGPCEAVSDQMIITINPPATANAGLDQTVCASSPIVTLAGSVGGVSGGTWSGGTGTFNPNANTLNAAYTPSPAEILAGTVTLTLTTNDPAGPCEAVSDQMIITINPPATANAGLDQTVCASSPIVTLAGSVGGVSGGTWSGGTGTFNPNANTLNAAYTPSPAEILAGTVTLTLTTNDPAGPCEAVSDQMIITINPPATANAGLDQTVCASSPIVTLAGSVGGVSGGTWSGGTGTFNPNANTLNAAYTPSPAEILAGTVTLTLTTNDPAGPCEAVSDQMIITINPPATANAGLDQTVCASSPIVTLAGSVGGVSGGTWSGGTGTFNPNANTLNAAYTPSPAEILAGTVTLTLTTNDPAGPCEAVSDQMIITINPPATANAGLDQTVCASSPIVTLAGSVGGVSGGTWSGGTGTFNPNANTLNAAYTPSPAEILAGTVTLTLTTNDPAGPCEAVSDQMIITINPPATANAGLDQTVCASSPIVTLAGSVGGVSGGTWSGGTGTFNPNANTLNAAYTPSPAEILAGTVTLTLTTNDPAGPCEAVSDQMIITINPPATANAGLDQTVCASSPIVTLAGSVGGVSGGTWSGGTGTFNPNANTLNAAYTPSPAEILAGTVTLTLTTNDPAGPCEAVSDQMIITINPPATANAGLDQTVCASSPIVTLAGSVGGVSGGTWSGGTGTFNPNANTLNAAYTPSPAEILAGTVTLTLTTNDPAGPCEAVSDQMIITINPPATANAGLDQTVCASSPIVTLAGSVGGVSGGTWSGGTGTFNPNANTLNAAYTPSPAEILAGTVTLTLTTNDPAGPCEAVSDQMIITINPPATANAGLDQTVCASSPIVTLAGSVGGVSGGTWSGGTGTFNPNANTLNAAYTPSPAEILAGTVTLTLTTNDPAGPCEAVSDQMIITINPPATANAGLDQTVCASSPIVTLAGSVGGVSGGTWSGGTGTFNPNANTLNAAYTPSPAEILAGTVTLTLTTNDPAGPCEAVSDQMIITINPPATANAGLDQTVCASSPIVTLAGSVGGVSGGTWSGGTGTFNPNANTLNAAYTPSPAEILAGTVTLTLTTNDPAGPCEAVSDQMIITINPPATANAGLDQTVCASSPIVTLAGSVGGVSGGTWSGGTGTFNPNANTLNAAYTPSPAEILAGTVTLTLTTNDPAGPCEAVSDQMIITINPPATANAGLDQTVCASSPIVTLAGSVGGVSGGTWSGGTGTFNPNANTLNAAYTPSPAEILAGTVTLTLTTNDPAGPCEAVSDQMIITINPPATANAGLDQTVCASSPIVTLAGSVGGVSGGTWSGGTGTFNPNANTLNAAYTPSPAEILAGTVTLTLTTNDPAGPCEAVSDQMIITINPPATANAGLDQTVCASSPIVTLAGSVGGVSGGTWSGGTGTFNPNANTLNAAYTPSPAEILAGTVTLTLTTNDPAGPCEAVSDQMIITINPPATANAGLDQTVCASSPIVTLAGSVGGVSGGTWSGGTGTFNPNANTLNAAYTPSPAEILAGTVTLTLTTNDPAGPCEAVSDQMIITINPPATANAGLDQTVCASSPIVTLAGSVGGVSGGTWSGGTGTFNPNANTLNAAYTPSPAEILAGTVTLTLTTNDPAGPCEAVSDNMAITINPNPICSLTPPNPLPFCSSTGNSFSGPAGLATYQWTVSGNGTLTGGQGTQTITYSVGASGNINIALTVTDANGCEASCQVEFECTPPPPGTFTSFTQGAYGNAGGKFNDETTLEILQRLITPDSALVVGKTTGSPANSITMPEGTEQCIINRLPAGGTPGKLPSNLGNALLSPPSGGCQTVPPLPLGAGGKWRNILLGQTVTLTLNARFDPELDNFNLCPQFKTQRALPGPNGLLGDEDDVPDPTDPGQAFFIPLTVLHALTAPDLTNTVHGLVELANRGLAGQPTGGASLSDINKAVDAINRGFDGCRFLVCCGMDCPPLSKEAQLTESATGEFPAQYTLEAFPNPFNPSTQVQFDLPEQTFVTVKIYNVLGQEVVTLVDHVEHEPGSYAFRFDASHLTSGIYFVRLQAAHHTMTRKILFAR
jgi:hypothetical protein